DLPFAKRLHSVAHKTNDADNILVADQRNAQHGANVPDERVRFLLVAWIREGVGNLYGRFGEYRATHQRAVSGHDAFFALDFEVLLPIWAIPRGKPIGALLEAIDHRMIGPAKANGGLDHTLQHGLQIEF